MDKRYTIGKYILVGVMLLIIFEYIVLGLSWLFKVFDQSVETAKQTTSGGGDFHIFTSFLDSAWAWFVALFSSSLGIAALIIISLLREAMESRWR